MGDILSLHVELTFVGLRYVVLFQFTPLALRRSVLDSVKMHAKCMYICYAPGYLLRIVQIGSEYVVLLHGHVLWEPAGHPNPLGLPLVTVQCALVRVPELPFTLT